MRMLLALAVKFSKVGHGQHRRPTARRSAKQRGLKPVVIPLRPHGPCDLGSFGPLQVLVSGTEANRATAGDLPQPQAHFKLQSKNFLILRTDNLLAGKLILPFEGRLPAIVLSSAVQPVEIIPAKPNAVPGSAEKCSAPSRNRCSPSSRNPVRNHPGM